MYMKSVLRAVAAKLQWGGFRNDDPAFVWVISGRGEIQLSEDGSCWWMRWDRTHAVADEVELTPPATTTDVIAISNWLIQQAEQLSDR